MMIMQQPANGLPSAGQIVPDRGCLSFPLDEVPGKISPPRARASPSVSHSGENSNTNLPFDSTATGRGSQWLAKLDQVDIDEYVPVDTFLDDYLGELEGSAATSRRADPPAGARPAKLAKLAEKEAGGGGGSNTANTEAQRRYRAKRKAQQTELSEAHERLSEKIRLLEYSAEENVALKGRVRLLAQVEAERSGDPARAGQLFTARALVEVEDAWQSTVEALGESLTRLGAGGRQDDVIRRLQHLVARSVDFCNLVATLHGPAVKQLLDASVLGSYSASAGYYNARMVEVARGAEIAPGQVSRIRQLRREFFEAMGKVYAERDRYNGLVLAEAGMSRPGITPSPASAADAGQVYRGIRGLRDLLSREQRLVTAFTRAFYTDCISPVQAARLISLTYPEHCCPITIANTLEQHAGS